MTNYFRNWEKLEADMEIKWFEDLISVAEIGHFARAAEARYLTQSALSRRIQSLEIWVGAELLDRSSHPISLTPAGTEFIPAAREIVSLAYEGRGRATEHTQLSGRSVTIACLHTLALYFVPQQIAKLRQLIGPFETSIVAETRTVEEYLTSLQNGTTDFFISFRHPSVPFDLDRDHFPQISLGTERIAPFASNTLDCGDFTAADGPELPYLQYSGTSFMSRVVESVLRKAPFAPRLKTVYRASLAESLSTGVHQGLGIAWLPASIANDRSGSSDLQCLSDKWVSEFEIIAVRASSNSRPIAEEVWEGLQRL